MLADDAQICLDPQRRADVPRLGSNGIDYVEVSERQPALKVCFMNEAPQNLGKANVVIHTDGRGRQVKILDLRLSSLDEADQDDCIQVFLDRRGGLGTYIIRLVELDADGNPTTKPFSGFDARYAQRKFTFDTAITSDIDCHEGRVCNPPEIPAPDINYVAKDYGSFLQLIYDRLSLTMPDWQERHVPDEMVALTEILAYTADYLSYYQDAVATEAYLGTARQRISVRRHVRLLDYAMHEGCNARTWATITTSELLTRLESNDISFVAGYDGFNFSPVRSPEDIAMLPAGSYLLFEPVANTIDLYSAHNEIKFYTWGDRRCCLPAGTRSATLLDSWETLNEEGQGPAAQRRAGPRNRQDVAEYMPREENRENAPRRRSLHLKPGDFMLIKEVIGPGTGSKDDADPKHCQVVRLTKVDKAFDSLYDPPVPVLEIEWAVEDALTFDVCLSAIGPAEDGCQPLPPVTVACGNTILVDSGFWIAGTESLGIVPRASFHQSCLGINQPADITFSAGAFRPVLKQSPVTFRQPIGRRLTAAGALIQDFRAALPQIKLRSIVPLPDGSGPIFSPEEYEHLEMLAARVANPSGDRSKWLAERLSRRAIALLKQFDPNKTTDPVLQQAVDQFVRVWNPQPDLLSSQADSFDFVLEVDDLGAAHLRFGDGELGRAPEAGESFFAEYRLGNGPDGNVGAGAIRYIVLDENIGGGANLTVTNPLPAQGGTACESAEEVKMFAPGAFLMGLERAIVAEDYAKLAESHPELQRAAATLLWTGTCYEAHVAIDPLGTEKVGKALIEKIQDYLYRFRRIGHDVVVVPAQYVQLDIAMTVTVLPGYIRDHVRAALLDAFSDQVLAGGKRGFFHPDNLTFGDNIYESQLIATAQSVSGVASAEVTRLQLLYAEPNHELEDGVLPIGPLEVAQLDNDPACPEHGRFALKLEGGL